MHAARHLARLRVGVCREIQRVLDVEGSLVHWLKVTSAHLVAQLLVGFPHGDASEKVGRRLAFKG